jgi:hypothetical protein
MQVPEGFRTRIGGNIFRDTPSLVVYLGTPLLTIEREAVSGRLLVDLAIFDSQGIEQARIEKTSFTQGNTTEFSISETDNLVKVQDHKAERVICELQRRDSTKGADLDVYVLTHAPDGFLIHASPVQSNIGGKASGKTFRNADAALVLEKRRAARKK